MTQSGHTVGRDGDRPLEAPAEQAASPLMLRRSPQERLEPSVEATAYFVAAETLKRSRPRRLCPSLEEMGLVPLTRDNRPAQPGTISGGSN
jgi:hypothetical protein